MARRVAAGDAAQAVARIKTLLDDFSSKLDDTEPRDQVRALVPVFASLRGLGKGLVPAMGAGSARAHLLAISVAIPSA